MLLTAMIADIGRPIRNALDTEIVKTRAVPALSYYALPVLIPQARCRTS